ncbi:hypothetical protein APHAL10511_002341 [Amanita phalloides]|nr:hypothetical protein APHAL10511_002341 [Amanita phalloides]
MKTWSRVVYAQFGRTLRLGYGSAKPSSPIYNFVSESRSTTGKWQGISLRVQKYAEEFHSGLVQRSETWRLCAALAKPSDVKRRTITLHSRHGPLVKLFWFNQESRRQSQLLPQSFWKALQDALGRMPNLEALHLSDNTFSNSWVLNPERFSFQLSDAKLRFAWDDFTVSFLQSQRKLRILQIIDQMDDVASNFWHVH